MIKTYEVEVVETVRHVFHVQVAGMTEDDCRREAENHGLSVALKLTNDAVTRAPLRGAAGVIHDGFWPGRVYEKQKLEGA